MTLNLDKNRDALISAWREVLDEKAVTNWALFGYDGQTFDLNCVAKGDGGLEELADEFNSGKIQYALARVGIKEKNVEKVVLINWQGEGAPLSRKGMCANHISTVHKFFKGVHVTMQARTDEEVDPDLIIQNISKAVAGDGVKMSSGENDAPVGPVGTVYKKTNPLEDINSTAKDAFWKKEEQEEERRKRDEQNKLRKFSQNEVKLLRRESQDYFNKEEEEIAQNKVSPTPPPAQQVNGRLSNGNGNGSIVNGSGSSQKEISEASAAAVKASKPMKNNTSSDLVRQRIKSFDNGSAPQGAMNGGKVNGSGDGESLSVSKRRQLFESGGASNITTNVVRRNPSLEIKEAQKIQEEKAAKEVKSVPSNKSNGEEKVVVGCGIQRAVSPQAPAAVATKVENKISPPRPNESPARSPVPTPISPSPVRQSPAPASPQPQGGVAPPPGFEDSVEAKDDDQAETITIEITAEMGLCARALYDYQAADDTEITFDPGEIISNIERIDEGWWEGLGPRGVFGLFPANYVELLN